MQTATFNPTEWKLVPREPTPKMLEEGRVECDVLDNGAHAVWDSMLTAAPSHVDQSKDRIASLFAAIAHGDDEHRTWLKEAIDAHFAGRPAPSPRGKGVDQSAGEVERLREALEQCELAAKTQMNECHRAAHSELIEADTKRGWASGAANSGVIYRKIVAIRTALQAPKQ